MLVGEQTNNLKGLRRKRVPPFLLSPLKNINLKELSSRKGKFKSVHNHRYKAATRSREVIREKMRSSRKTRKKKDAKRNSQILGGKLKVEGLVCNDEISPYFS